MLEQRKLLAADFDLLSGNVVSRVIDAAGDVDRFDFTVAAPTRVCFDAFTNDYQLNWSLSGPAGALVSQRDFTSSDSLGVSNPAIELAPGNYEIAVAAAGSHVGPYSFRLIDLSSAVEITPGVQTDASLDPANETDAYRFSAAAGDKFFFDSLSASTQNAVWRLIDPYGRDVFQTYLSNDVGTTTLLAAGSYTLLAEGYVADPGAISYSFNVQPQGHVVIPPFAGTAMALDATINGDIATAGEEDQYAFTLAADALAAFDNLIVDDGSLQWSLQGPSGQIVGNQSMLYSDWYYSNTFKLPAGNYQLTVSATGGATGPYGFRLLDLSSASPITPGVEVDGTLDPANVSKAYQFTATAGDKFYFDSLNSNTQNAAWRLIGPYGQQIFQSNLSGDVSTLALPSTGVYALLIEGYPYDTGSISYSFKVQPVATPTSAPLALGATINGALATAGQQDAYDFTLAADTLAAFDNLIADNGSLQWSLAGPSGEIVGAQSFIYSDWFYHDAYRLPAGEYRLTVSAAGDATGNYSFRLLDLSAAAPITPGARVDGTLDPANETQAYKFSASAGDRFYFDSLNSNTQNATWRLIDPYGQQTFQDYLSNDAGLRTLSAGGAYTLLVEGDPYDSGTIDYSFNVQPVPPTPSTPLALGATVSGAIPSAGAEHDYTLTLANPARLTLDSLNPRTDLGWRLSGPAGQIVSYVSFADGDWLYGDPTLKLQPGDYRLTVFSPGGATGDYSFRVLDLAAATPLTPGTPIAGSLNPANESDLYKFVAAAGDKFYFDSLSVDTQNAAWQLVDPYGRQVDYDYLSSDIGTLAMPVSGTYTLFVQGHPYDTGTIDYSVNVQPIPVPVPTPLSLGATVNGNLPTAGKQDLYTFTLGADALAAFDGLTADANLEWSLSGPAGLLVDRHSFPYSDNLYSSGSLKLAAGDYQLTVSAAGGATGDYSFRLLDLADATSLTPGVQVDGTLDPANETDAYKFTVAAGDKFYFDSLSSNTQNAAWRLIDPYGQQVFWDFLSNDVNTLTLSAAGTYTLLVEGNASDTGATNYNINVQPQGNDPPAPFTGVPVTLGDVVNGAIATSGQADQYVFTLGADTRVAFDNLITDGNLKWSLVGPSGQVVTDQYFVYSDGFNGAPFALVAGDYQLTVSALGDATGSYSFRLLDLAAAAAITPGVQVNGTLDPANQSQAFQFTAAAGDRFYFDALNGNTQSASWRLIGPYGQEFFRTYLGSDVATLTLPVGGAYTLLVEGYLYDAGTTDFSFNVQPVATPSPTPLVLGATINGDVSSLGAQDLYVFTLGADTLVAFDGLITDGNLKWSLVGPSGQVVTDQYFIYSDGFNGAPIALVAGDYQLTVSAWNDATGAYSFRLLDLAAAAAITPGVQVDGTLAPANQSQAFQFTAAAGDKFYFDALNGNTQNASWRLIGPYGQQFFQTYLGSDVATLALPVAGAYTLLVEGYYYDAGTTDFSFNVQPVATPSPTPLVLGVTVNGGIPSAGAQDLYVFTLGADTFAAFDNLITDGNLKWSLVGPTGQVVTDQYFISSDGFNGAPFALVAGDYRLTVSAWNGSTGAYNFRLLDLAAAAAITPGVQVDGTLDPANETRAFQFTAAAGDKFYFDSLNGNTQSASWRLIGPYGQQFFQTYLGSDAPTLTLPAAGAYTLLAEGYYNDAGTTGFSFNVQPVDTPPLVNAGADLQVDEGANADLTVQFSDLDTSQHWAEIDWNDGSPVQSLGLVVSPFTASHAYGDNGVYQATVRIANEDGFIGSDVVTVTVDNVAPTAAIGGPASVNEGETIDLTVSGSDVAADTLAYVWDLDGDGVFGETGADAAGGDENRQNPTLNAANLDGPGVHVVWLRVSDEDGGVTSISASITVVNVAPTASAGGPYSVNEGQTGVLSGSGSDVPGDPLTYAWDLDGDGVFGETGADALYGDENAQNPTFNAATLDGPTSKTVKLRVSDDDGGVKEVTAVVNVANVAPSASAGGPYSVNEGQTVVLAGSASDVPGDPLTYVWDLDGDGVFGETGADALYGDENAQNPTFNAASLDGPTSKTVKLQVSDDDGGVKEVTAVVTVNNVAPSVSAGGPYSVSENQTVVLSGSATDVPGDTLAYVWDLDGDGVFGETGAEALYGDENVQNPTFDAAPLDGPTAKTVALRVSDDDGGVNEATAVVTVNNVAPSASAGGPYSVNEGQSVVLSGAGSDVPGDPLTYVWDLDGDGVFGETGAEALYGDENVQNPAFDAANLDGPTSKTVTLRVSDDDGGVKEATAVVTVNNVAPSVSIGGPYSVNEGQTIVLAGSASDVPGDPLAYVWDLDGDGAFGETGADALYGDENVQNPTFDAANLDGPATLPISLKVSDDDGGATTVSGTVAVNNVAPSASAGGPYAVNEGQTVVLSGSGSDVPGDALAYVWDLDGDGVFGETGADALYGDENVRNPTFNATNLDGPATLPISVKVSDDDGGATTVSGTVTVNNVAPSASIGGPYSVNEGQTVVLSGSGSDVPGDALAYVWDLDGDGVFGETGVDALYGDENVQNPTFDVANVDGPATLPISLKVSDEDGGVRTVSGTVTVNNVAPSAVSGGPYVVNQGGALVLSGSASDVPGDTLAYAWDLDGDGVFGETGADALYGDENVQNPTFDASTLVGTFVQAIQLRVADDDGDATTVSDTVKVVAPPTADAGGPYAAEERGTSNLSGSGAAANGGALTFAWDLDGDGAFGESGADAANGDENVQNPMFEAANIDGLSAIIVYLRVSEADGGTTTVSATITVNNVAPSASAGGPYSVDEGQSVVFSGSGSDVPGDPLTYVWDLDGDGVFGETGADALYGDENVQNPTFDASNLDGPATLTVNLKVSDEDGGVTTVSGTVTVNNVAPTASAGGPHSVSEGQTVVLSGSASDVPGDTLTYVWDLDGDGLFGETGADALYGDENVQNPTFDAATLDGPTAKTVALRVSDDDGGVNEATAVVTVNNVAPSASAGGPYSVNEGQTVVLSGSASDVPGDTLTYVWDLDGDGLFGETGADALYGDENVQNPTFKAANLDGPATLTVSLKVSDEDGGVTIVSGTVTLNNVAPTASAGGPYSVNEGQTVVLSGSASDVPGDTLAYVWDLDGDGVFGETGPDALYGDENLQNPTFDAANLDGPTSKTVALRVSDDDGGVNEATAVVTVNNAAPSASAGGPYGVNEGQSVVLSGSGSDVPGDTLSYVWDLDGDGVFGETGADALYGDENVQNPTLNAANLDGPATLPIGLKVSDDDGGEKVISGTVTVTNVAPAVSAGGPYLVDEGKTITLNGSASDVPGDPLVYAWDLDGDGVFGETGADALYGDENVQNPVFNAAGLTAPATVLVSMRVSDDDGGVTTASGTVNVTRVDESGLFTGSPATIRGTQATPLVQESVATFAFGDGSEPAGSFTATIEWGDGGSSAGAVTHLGATYAVLGDHVYNDFGQFDVQVTIAKGATTTSVHSTANVVAAGTPFERFVAAVYLDVLARLVEPAGLQYWTQQLASGVPHSSVARAISHSDEYYANLIIRPAYLRYLGREADDSGVAYWTQQMQAGLTDEQLEAEFIASDEFYATAGGTSPNWIDAAYRLLLGRDADAAGRDYWLERLANGESRSTIALGFARSVERQRQRVSDDYFHYLGRAAEPDALDYWVYELNHGQTNEDLISGLTGSDEYFNNYA